MLFNWTKRANCRGSPLFSSCVQHHHHHHHHHHHYHHQSLNREGRWGTTDDFATSFLHFSVLHCTLGPAELQACPFPVVVFPPLPLPALSSSPFTVPCKMVLARPDEREARPCNAVCVSLRSSGLRVVQLPAGSWHGLPR